MTAAAGEALGTSFASAAGSAVGAKIGDGESHRGARLAIAIVLMWLAGFLFFIAFAGSKVLPAALSPGGGPSAILGALRDAVTGKTSNGGDSSGGGGASADFGG